MKSVVYKNPQTIGLENVPNPSPGEDEVQIKVGFVGVCGTDLMIVSGHHPRAPKGLIPGHEFSGTIVKRGENATEIEIGARVVVYPLVSCGHCAACENDKAYICETLRLYGVDRAGGMAEFVNVHKKNIISVPEEVSLRLAALAEPVAVVVHACALSPIKKNQVYVVCGAGPLAFLTCLYLKQYHPKAVLMVDDSKERLKKAKECGIAVHNSSDGSIKDALSELSLGMCDVLYEYKGSNIDYADVFDAMTPGGTVVVGSLHKKRMEIDLLQAHFKELQIRASRVYTPEDFRVGLEFIGTHPEVESVITSIISIDTLSETLGNFPRGGLKTLAQPHGDSHVS